MQHVIKFITSHTVICHAYSAWASGMRLSQICRKQTYTVQQLPPMGDGPSANPSPPTVQEAVPVIQAVSAQMMMVLKGSELICGRAPLTPLKMLLDWT